MNAAKTSSIESVQILLRKNVKNETLADPNVVDEKGQTALAYALKTNNIQVINMLAEVTTEVSETTMKMLAQSNVKIEGDLEKYVKIILNDGQQEIYQLDGICFLDLDSQQGSQGGMEVDH